MTPRPAIQQSILILSIAVTVILLLLSGSLAAWSAQRESISRFRTVLERAAGTRTEVTGASEAPDAEPQLETLLTAYTSVDEVSTSRNRRFFWGAVLSLLVGALTWSRLRALTAPQQELLDAIERVQKGEIRNPIFLPAGHPFLPVAETVNRLIAGLENQSRIISEQHHRQQILLNSISEGILVLDNDLNIIGINPVAAQWLETGNPIRAQGKPLYKLCRNPTLLSMTDDLLAGGDMKEAHLRLERDGGEDRIVQLRGSLLIDRDQTEGVIILMQDVTTLRRLETLRQDFVANVSHELRTPLTSIKGYAELLTEETDDPAVVQKYSDRILMQSERMVNIIDDLLSLTRIESAHGPESVTRCEIRPLLENVAALVEDAAQRRNLTLILDAEEDLSAVLHAPLFEQAVLNLVQNAVKYTHPETRITVKAYQQDSEAVIEVIDQGPGIAPQHHARLFERFYRVDKARSRAVGGTGLGLSIVKHIAQLHHGSVEVESELGNGTRFRLKVPLEYE
jgi:two-component system phosphate regulon sensor histidine kinase PhoR